MSRGFLRNFEKFSGEEKGEKGGRIRSPAGEPRRLQVSPGHLLRAAFRIRSPKAEKDQSKRIGLFLVGEDGFEPSKRNAADLQSVPFGHSGTPPDVQL